MSEGWSPSALRAERDWQRDLAPGENLHWQGRPRIGSDILIILIALFFAAQASPVALIFGIIPVANILLYARDRYALTDQRILLYRQPLGGEARLDSLPRAGSLPAKGWWRGTRTMVFTAADQRQMQYHLLGREDHGQLMGHFMVNPKGKL